jgi:hypothetical protein
MIEWLKSLPKTIFVAIVLTAGVLFIVLSDPPHTVCDSQVEAFNEATKDFLALDSAKANKKQTRFARLVETCKATNSPGGCYELFMNVKSLLRDSRTVSPECNGKLASHDGYTKAIWESLDLMVKIAWGEKPPQTPALKVGWFDPSDLNLFCLLKDVAINVYSQDRWNSFVEGYFTSLPAVSTLPRNDVWQRMLLSLNCSSYL